MITKVLLATDKPESMRLFSEALAADPQLRTVAIVTSGRAAIALLDAQTPDVMLIDLRLPDIDGALVIRHAAERHADCQCLVLAMPEDDQRLKAAIDAGASGFLLEDASAAEITSAIHELRAGGSPISPRIARRMLERLRGATAAGASLVVPDAAPAASPLSRREHEILRLAAKGFNFETIGDLLTISTNTVGTHAKRIYRKLAVHSRSEAIYEAFQMGWL